MHRRLYRKALTELKKKGITLKTARCSKFLLNMRQPFIKPYKDRLEEFLNQRKIKWIQCQSIDKISRLNMKYMYVVGHMVDEKKYLLYKTWCSKETDINDVLKEWLSVTFG